MFDREAPRLKLLEERFAKDAAAGEEMMDQSPVLVLAGQYVGQSTCNNFTSALGAAQRVLSYSYYRPDQLAGKPTDTVERFLGLFQPLAESARRLFPGWRLRIYHNVTSEDSEALDLFCELHCNYSFIDLCDTRNLPGIGDLNAQFPVGRFWRFQPLADPTVEIFGSRDSDSFLSEREAAAVSAWLRSGEQFHVMRDGPFHTAPVLAGLWGAVNYINMSKAVAVRKSLLSVKPNLDYSYDQQILRSVVWPIIRDSAAIFDSYFCRDVQRFGHSRPWPTKGGVHTSHHFKMFQVYTLFF